MFETNPYNYNPYFPQSMAYGYQQQQQNSQIQGIRFVQGLQEAQSCTIPLGTKSIFMDMNKDVFYLKEMDFNGVSKVTEYEFKPVEHNPVDNSNFITRAEFEKWKEEYEQLVQQRYASQSAKQFTNEQQIDGKQQPTAEYGSVDAVYQNDLSAASESTSGANVEKQSSLFK